MPQTTAMIGIHPDELRWIRMLVMLLRHPDPGMPELARQALLYLSESAGKPAGRFAESSQESFHYFPAQK
jgi:hypothetical protein